MKTTGIFGWSLAAALALTVQLHSQTPAAPKTVLQQLQEMKTKNQLLLEKQTATMARLDALQKEAQQTRFLMKRG